MDRDAPQLPKRRSIRLKGFDYSQAGNYFVTICSHNRHFLFGKIAAGETRLSRIGQLVTECWYEIPRHFPGVELPAIVVMPNHIHGLLLLYKRARHAVPLHSAIPAVEAFSEPVERSLPTILRSFKGAVTRRVRETLGRDIQVWQRGYFERVIRNGKEFGLAQNYILQNPIRWEFDRENPFRKASRPTQADPFEKLWTLVRRGTACRARPSHTRFIRRSRAVRGEAARRPWRLRRHGWRGWRSANRTWR